MSLKEETSVVLSLGVLWIFVGALAVVFIWAGSIQYSVANTNDRIDKYEDDSEKILGMLYIMNGKLHKIEGNIEIIKKEVK